MSCMGSAIGLCKKKGFSEPDGKYVLELVKLSVILHNKLQNIWQITKMEVLQAQLDLYNLYDAKYYRFLDSALMIIYC